MRSTLILALAALPFINALTVSKSGQRGASNGLTCKGSTFGSCCSQHNYCGSTSAYCGTGCQSGYGTCISTTTPVTPAKVSTDGTCGGTKGYTCLKSVYGNCCSQYGFCGSTSAYCGTGCNSGFGSCAGTADSSSVRTSSNTRSSTRSTRSSSISTHTSSSAAPSSTLKVTINSRCGVGFTQFTCQGSKWGNCCSQYSYCGSTNAYCGKGCQTGFGTCNPSSASSSLISATASSPSTSSSTSSTVVSGSPSSTTVSSSSSSSISEAPSSTSSSVVSSTTVASSSSACALAPTNAVQNPGFETGSLDSWFETDTGSWDALGLNTAAHSGKFDFYGYTDSNAQATITLLQENVLIPSGTLVDCTAYAFGNRNSGETTTFVLMIDGQQCGTSLVITTSVWTHFGGQVTVVGDSHSVSIEVVSSGSDEAGMNFGVDDIFVAPAAAAGATTCPTSNSISSSATSSSSSSSSESSTVVSTTSSDVPSSTSSLVISTTTSPTPSSSSCVPAGQTNAVSNPSFETGALPPWVESQTGKWSDIRIVGGRPHSGTFYFFGATDSETAATVTISQTNIFVVDGTVVNCYMWVNAYRNPPYTTTFTLSLDGVECGGVTVVDTDYLQVGGQIQVSGNSHVVTVVISSSGSDEASSLFGVDDISVIPISGPGFIDTCAIASPAPATPASTGVTN